MDERLEAFREAAELHVERPAFEGIEQRGRTRRLRRRAVVGAVAASALAVSGFFATAGSQSPDPQPAGPSTPRATPYPGPELVTLEAGTYELTPFTDVTLPAAHVTVPDGWDASYAPDRFSGIGPVGADNERAQEQSTWYAGLLVTQVGFITMSNCNEMSLSGADTAEVLSALTALPRVDVTFGPERATRLGYPAYHLVLQETRRRPTCPYDAMFPSAQGRIGNVGLGGTYDLWLVDVEGEPLLVVTAWTRNAPRTAVEELQAMADTIELHPRRLPWRE